MKTLPLIRATLKSFVRNWHNISVLVILPLLLILSIFVSFNADGLKKIEIGYVIAQTDTLDEAEFQEAVKSFATATRYESLSECTSALQTYSQYACVEITGSGPYVLNVYYDNTREPVIWEIIERLEQTVRMVQRSHSRDIATDFLSRFQTTLKRLDNYQSSLETTTNQLDGYKTQVSQGVSSLQSARQELIETLETMDDDIAQARAKLFSAQAAKDQYVSEANMYLSFAETQIASNDYEEEPWYIAGVKNNLAMTEDTLDELDDEVDNELSTAQSQLVEYEMTSLRGKERVDDLNSGISRLSQVRTQLNSYQRDIEGTQRELENIQTDFKELETLDAETLVNPVVIHNIPAYIPGEEDVPENVTSEDAARGLNFISLQTIFPTVLIMIILFLSLLIGSFVGLNEVNQKAHERVRLIKNSFFPEFLATYLSALIIVFIPTLLVLLIGDQLFRLGIFYKSSYVFPILFLLISNYVFLGLILAYLVRKESLTLMIGTFLLVLLLFFTGFMLPIERMSDVAAIMSLLNPATIALNGFKQVIFYGATASTQAVMIVLTIEAFILSCSALLLKHFRE